MSFKYIVLYKVILSCSLTSYSNIVAVSLLQEYMQK